MARSYLFIPGNVPRMLTNADVFEADALVIDWEDAIAANEKDEARELTTAYLENHRPENTHVYVRINSEEGLIAADIAALGGADIDGIVLPKASIATLDRYVGLFGDETPFDVIALVETPAAFFELERIAGHERVGALFLGGEDFRTAIGAEKTESAEEILLARNMVVLAAKAKGITAIDTPFTSLQEEGLAEDCAKARSLGFDAKSAIHPDQVATINRTFAPAPKEIRAAKRIVKRHREEGSMRFRLDGKMVDRPIIERAKRLLEKARLYGMTDTEEE